MADFYPDGAILLAPLSGYTDYPYRKFARRFGCRYAFTEMIDAAALVYARERTNKMLFRGADEPFLGVQLVGSDRKQLAEAARILNDLDFDVLDFNLGCPVPKVAKKGAGAVLGRNIPAALECFEALAENSRFPLTAKIRIASEHDVSPTLEIVRRLHEAGAKAVTIHGRIKEKIYSGPVHFDQIKLIKESVPVQIIANGGVKDRTTYLELTEKTSCRTVMAARGAMGNFWLFDNFRTPDRAEVLSVMREHILLNADYYGEEAGFKLSRKTIHDYLKGRGFNGEWRGGASYVSDRDGFEKWLAQCT